MGIFTRVRDIISANINTMLEKAEDPEKLVKLMIREMEDTLIEVKASCAGAMATKKKIQRELEEVSDRAEDWGAKARAFASGAIYALAGLCASNATAWISRPVSSGAGRRPMATDSSPGCKSSMAARKRRCWPSAR